MTCPKARPASPPALLFEDVDDTVARLEKAGVEIKERQRLAINAEVLHKMAFLRDPDGI
ncbi:VOC family protein [Rhizobium lentis]|uniref:VOC family protein n=1 Tax=Rhizobium lentis TaxID=1138194 RepID=UPI0035C91BD5